MKKITIFLMFGLYVSFASHSQLMVAKLVGKDALRTVLGMAYSLTLTFHWQVATSFRIELMDLAFFPTKGENFFTSTAGAKGYISIKLGYKYVFSERKQASILYLQLVIAGP